MSRLYEPVRQCGRPPPSNRVPAAERTARGSPALRFLYWLYERRLLRQVRGGPMPRHVGIILDGNRRYGRRIGLNDTNRIYTLAAQKLDGILAWCSELHVPAGTLWVFRQRTCGVRRPK